LSGGRAYRCGGTVEHVGTGTGVRVTKDELIRSTTVAGGGFSHPEKRVAASIGRNIENGEGRPEQAARDRRHQTACGVA
jgi:N-methylhydantoinase B/oxoprolinase/acetone carboxylase alpha subunit